MHIRRCSHGRWVPISACEYHHHKPQHRGLEIKEARPHIYGEASEGSKLLQNVLGGVRCLIFCIFVDMKASKKSVTRSLWRREIRPTRGTRGLKSSWLNFLRLYISSRNSWTRHTAPKTYRSRSGWATCTRKSFPFGRFKGEVVSVGRRNERQEWEVDWAGQDGDDINWSSGVVQRPGEFTGGQSC